MITLKLPGLPGEDGRPSWQDVCVEYVSGRTLSAYLVEQDLPHELVSHVIVNGQVIEPGTMVTVPVPETKWQRRWRKLQRKPAPTVQVSAFDAYIPARGADIYVVPHVATKNKSLTLGIIGGIIGVGVMVATGGAAGLAGWKLAAAGFKAFMIGNAVGSTIGAMLTPRPKPIKDQDGPSSYFWNGIGNDDRAGIPEPIMLGERLVGGVRIGLVRRRGRVVPVRTAPGDYDNGNPWNGSEKLHLLVLVAAHKTEGPVGKANPNVSLGASGSATSATSNAPDIRVNGQHFSNFSGVKVHWRTGAAGQSVIPGFDVVANTYDMAVSLTDLGAGVWHTYTTASDQVDAIEVLFTLPSGLCRTNDSGGLQYNKTRYRLEYRKVGDATWLKFDDVAGVTHRELTDKTMATVTETRRVESLPRGRYEVRAQWVSADYTDVTRDRWHVYLSGITEETQQAINYEGKSLVAIESLATEQLSGPPPTVTSVWRGYIPQTWTAAGGFAAASWGVGQYAPPGRNPFWLALALMRDKSVGAGNEIPDADIDLASFKAAADYAGSGAEDTAAHAGCENVAPVGGAAYHEPRFQFDAYIDQPQNTVDLLQQIFGTCRAALINSGNKWSVGVDRPGTLTQYFGMGSIVEGSFSQQFKSERHEVNCFDATFEDRAAEWETDSHTETIDNREQAAGGGVFRTEDEILSLGIPVLRRQMQLWGVTRRSQVAREIRFALRQTYALREFGGFTASTKAILCQVYDLIGISHDVPQWGYSGRVREGSEAYTGAPANLVMFDREVPLESGTSYQVRVHFKAAGPDGKDLFEIRDVADGVEPVADSEYFGVTVTSPFSRIPAAGDEWYYGPVGKEVRPARIVDIDRNADDQRVISWGEYNASVYDVSGPIVIPNYSLLPDMAAPPGAITSLTFYDEFVLMPDGTRRLEAVIQWTAPKPARTDGIYKGAKLEHSFDNATWSPIVSTDGTEYRWPSPPPGATIYLRATPYSISGKYNYAGAKTIGPITVRNYEGAAPAVTGISSGYADGAFWVKWNDLGPEFEYEVRDQNPADWKASTAGFRDRGRRIDYYDGAPVARSITFYVRARDRFGNYSASAASTSVTDTAPAAPTINAITRFKDSIKINVSPPASTPDIVAIHLHASQTPGFTPSYANRVGNPVGANGGDFFFRTSVTGTWYFKATCEDWLSQRMADWIYTNQQADSIVVIQPVNPASPALGLVNDPSDGHLVEDPLGKWGPKTPLVGTVSWTHNDTTNPAGSLIGFEVVIYTTSIDSPRNRITINDPTKRTIIVKGLVREEGVTLNAGVKALYVDGLTSDLVLSTGQVIPQDSNPKLRDSDDRQVPGYSETFDSASLPSGVTVLNSSYSLATAGEIAITRTSGTSTLRWDVATWGAVNLDRLREGAVNAVILLKVPVGATGAGALTVTVANQTPVTLDVIADGNWHAYVVPAGIIGIDTIIQWSLAVNTGTTWYVKEIAIAFQGFDLSNDGWVNRGNNARDQYGKDSNGGLYGISPVRISDQGGNFHVVDKNGLFYLYNDAGQLVTETPYKRGRMGYLRAFGSGASDSWANTLGTASPPPPKPTSLEKFRMLIEDKGNQIAPGSPPAYPIRRWMEAIVDGDGFRTMARFFYGGTLKTYSVAGPWTQSEQAKSSLSLGTSADTTDSNDAWYYVADDAGLPNTGDDKYFRVVVELHVQMPDAKNAKGSRYYCDLDFDIRIGRALSPDGGNTMDFDFVSWPPLKLRNVRLRALTDGRLHKYAIVCDVPSDDLLQANVKVDWHTQTLETGGSGPTSVAIGSIKWDYIENLNNSSPILSNGALFGYTSVEEFGG